MGGHEYRGIVNPPVQVDPKLRAVGAEVIDAWDDRTSARRRAARLDQAIAELRKMLGMPPPPKDGMTRRTKPYPSDL